jgi:acyl-homoserine-lactone acylase
MPRTGPRLAGAAVLAAALLTPVTASAATVAGSGMSATIRYTEYGIPHITAPDYAGLGYGTGYAAAKDNICLIAQGVVTLHGERSKYFGPDASPDKALSSASTNLASDVFFTGINDSGIVERLAAAPAPAGPSTGRLRAARSSRPTRLRRPRCAANWTRNSARRRARCVGSSPAPSSRRNCTASAPSTSAA